MITDLFTSTQYPANNLSNITAPWKWCNFNYASVTPTINSNKVVFNGNLSGIIRDNSPYDYTKYTIRINGFGIDSGSLGNSILFNFSYYDNTLNLSGYNKYICPQIELYPWEFHQDQPEDAKIFNGSKSHLTKYNLGQWLKDIKYYDNTGNKSEISTIPFMNGFNVEIYHDAINYKYRAVCLGFDTGEINYSSDVDSSYTYPKNKKLSIYTITPFANNGISPSIESVTLEDYSIPDPINGYYEMVNNPLRMYHTRILKEHRTEINAKRFHEFIRLDP